MKPETSQHILEKTRELAKKPSQLTAFMEGVECGNQSANPDIKMASEWMQAARDEANRILVVANCEATTILERAKKEAETTRFSADFNLRRAQEALDAERISLKAQLDELEANPKHLAARQLLKSMLADVGYPIASTVGGRRSEVPSAVLCHVATMVAAVAGENPVSIAFGQKSTQ